jgi:hypothetical protein
MSNTVIVHLPSNSLDYPDNKSNHYRVHLGRTLKFPGDWVCGLHSIIFPFSWPTTIGTLDDQYIGIHYDDDRMIEIPVAKASHTKIEDLRNSLNKRLADYAEEISKTLIRKRRAINNLTSPPAAAPKRTLPSPPRINSTFTTPADSSKPSESPIPTVSSESTIPEDSSKSSDSSEPSESVIPTVSSVPMDNSTTPAPAQKLSEPQAQPLTQPEPSSQKKSGGVIDVLVGPPRDKSRGSKMKEKMFGPRSEPSESTIPTDSSDSRSPATTVSQSTTVTQSTTISQPTTVAQPITITQPTTTKNEEPPRKKHRADDFLNLMVDPKGDAWRSLDMLNLIMPKTSQIVKEHIPVEPSKFTTPASPPPPPPPSPPLSSTSAPSPTPPSFILPTDAPIPIDKIKDMVDSVEFQYDMHKDRFKVVFTDEKITHLSLSTQLAYVLGFENPSMIQNNDVAKYKTDLRGGFTSFGVYVKGLTGNVIIGNSLASLLRIVNVNGAEPGENVEKIYDSPLFVNVLPKEVSEIEVRIDTLDGKPVPFQYGNVIIVLIFKKVINF